MSIINITPPTRFVGLHGHTGFSVFDGLGYPDEHINFVLENDMDAWGLTDHGNGSGLAHAHKHATKIQKSGRKYRQIYGCEFYFVPSLKQWEIDYKQSKLEKAESKQKSSEEEDAGHVIENEDETKTFDANSDEWKRRYHLVVTAQNREGLGNLFTLIKRAYTEGFYRYPRIDFDMLRQHGKGLNVSTACLHPDTKVQTSIGKITVKEIVDKINDNKFTDEIFILSHNENKNKNEFKKVVWGDVTRKNAKLMKLTDKNGNEVKLTPDHKVYTDSGWKEAKDLTTNDKILSLNL
jgi:DNA polymerase III alpha subunit